MPQFGKRTVLTRQHFAEFEAAFGDDPLGGPEHWPSARTPARPAASVASPASRSPSAGDSLDIAWLKDESGDNGDELPEPEVLAQEAMVELEGALEELRGILAELGEEIEEIEA